MNLRKNAFKFFKIVRRRKNKKYNSNTKYNYKNKKGLIEQFRTVKFKFICKNLKQITKLKKKIKRKYVSTKMTRNPFILVNIRNYNISKHHKSYVFNTYNISL